MSDSRAEARHEEAGKAAEPGVKRLVRVITRLTITGLFLAILGTVAVAVGYAGQAECLPDCSPPAWVELLTTISGALWGVVLVLLLILPVPLFMSLSEQRRRRKAEQG
jgi:hypothetical protein